RIRFGTSVATSSLGYILVGHSNGSSIDSIVNRVTVSAWVYLVGSVTDWGTALSRQIGSTLQQDYHISLDPMNRPHVFVQPSNPTDAGSNIDNVEITDMMMPAPRFTWTHIAATYNGTEAHLYMNGTDVTGTPPPQGTGTFAPDTTPLILGGNA